MPDRTTAILGRFQTHRSAHSERLLCTEAFFQMSMMEGIYLVSNPPRRGSITTTPSPFLRRTRVPRYQPGSVHHEIISDLAEDPIASIYNLLEDTHFVMK